jgi:RNAse (barnase) inhibitor barstar
MVQLVHLSFSKLLNFYVLYAIIKHQKSLDKFRTKSLDILYDFIVFYYTHVNNISKIMFKNLNNLDKRKMHRNIFENTGIIYLFMLLVLKI